MAITLPIEAINAVNAFLLSREAAVPDDVRDKLIGFIGNGSPVVDSVNIAELIYARRDDLPAQLNSIGADIAAMCASFNFHGLRDSGRGMAIAAALRAMPGVPELVTPVEAPAEPPAPLPQFAAETAPVEPPAA